MKHVRSLRVVVSIAFVIGCLSAGSLPVSADTDSVRNPEGRSSPMAMPAVLHQVEDCDDLRLFITEAFLDSLLTGVYWAWDSPWSQPGTEGGGDLDFTGTNNQEEGVDELDIVKTDGEFVYVARSESVVILRSWPPQETAIVTEIPVDGTPIGIFLLGDRLAVISWDWNLFENEDFNEGGVRIELFDIKDRTRPTPVRTIQFQGFLSGSRLLDGTMYFVTQSWITTPIDVWDLMARDDLGLPEIDPSAPSEEYEAALEEARRILGPLVAEIVAEMDLSEILPVMTDSLSDVAEPTLLLKCEDVFKPSVRDQLAALSVVSVDFGSGQWTITPVDATGILTSGGTVYASRDNLYVAQGTAWWWWGPFLSADAQGLKTVIHAFDLGSNDSDAVVYRASGEVPGMLLNQFAMSEYDGHLRVATYHPRWIWWAENEETGTTVTILRDNGLGFLESVGQITEIAPGETLFASRFLGERGYLVTFEVIDPLFTLDLSDPTEPRLTGELEIPGYSAYLHPMDDHHLLAIGMNGDEEGRLNGLALKVFDVADLEDPRLVHDFVLNPEENDWSWSEALADHHAFTFRNGILAFPAVEGRFGEPGFFAGLKVFGIDLEDGISELGNVSHDDLFSSSPDDWGWSAIVRRSLFIEDAVYSLSGRGVKANDLHDPQIEFAAVPFIVPETVVSPPAPDWDR